MEHKEDEKPSSFTETGGELISNEHASEEEH